MKRQYADRMHDGIGYSKNAEEAWFRGERPRSAPDFSGVMETVKHHIEVPDTAMISGYRRVFAMFYKHAATSDTTTKPKIVYAIVSKNGIMIRIVDNFEQAKLAGSKMAMDGAKYILPCKVIPDGDKIEIISGEEQYAKEKTK